MGRRILNVLELQQQLRDEHVVTLVHRFYERVQQDELLGPVFARRIAPAGWPAHLDRMVRFWSTILRGTPAADPQHYTGDPMRVHRDVGGITRAHFARWLELFRETADAHLPGVLADSIVQRAERMGASLAKAVSADGSSVHGDGGRAHTRPPFTSPNDSIRA